MSTFYIDFDTGSDSNTSTQAQSQATPWKYAPGMNGVSGAAASYVVQAADVFVFKGGVTWTFASSASTLYTIPASGITLMGGQQLGTPWGTGLPVFDGTGVTGIGRYGILSSSKSGCTLDGIAVKNISSNFDGSGFGIAVFYVASGWEIKNCLIDNTGVDAISMSLDTSAGNGSGFKVHDCTFQNCGRFHVLVADGVTFDDVEVYNNTFYGVGNWDAFKWVPASGGSGYVVGDQLTVTQSGASGVVIQVAGVSGGAITSFIKITQGTGYTAATGLSTVALTGSGSGCIVNVTEFHGGGIMIGSSCTTNPSTFTNILIHDNAFSKTWSATALIYLNGGTGYTAYGGYGAKIYNNQLCIDSNGVLSPAIIDIGSGWRNVEIYNNTLDVSASSTNPVANGIGAYYQNADANLIIKNNIISGTTNGINALDLAAGAGLTADYNLYRTTGGDKFIWDSGTRYNTLAAVQAAGYEAHGAVTSDVGFVSLPDGTDGSGNWHLTAGSPAVGMGLDLSASIGTTDLDGYTRSSPWTLGAYTYPSGSVPAAPTTLAASAIDYASIGLTWADASSDETGFELERSLDGSTGWSVVASPAANDTSATDGSLLATTTYYYRIRAVNAFGYSTYSNTANATTDVIPYDPASISDRSKHRLNPGTQGAFL